jgi:hypothetical protein
MKITKKFDRAFQWAGEKMGSEAKTAPSDEFKMLETEMALRIDGMEKMQRSMNAYIKWLAQRTERLDDKEKEKGTPGSCLGRTMSVHGEDFEPDSEFGNCLIGTLFYYAFLVCLLFTSFSFGVRPYSTMLTGYSYGSDKRSPFWLARTVRS